MWLSLLSELEDVLRPSDFIHLEEGDAELKITFSVPGFKKEDLIVTLTGEKVVVRGKNSKGKKVYLVSYFYGKLDLLKAKAALESGQLTVSIPKDSKDVGIQVQID